MIGVRGPVIDVGTAYPLGATWDGKGVNFALFSNHAEKVELCIFDQRGRRELLPDLAIARRIRMASGTATSPDARPGLRYGYRVLGTVRTGLRDIASITNKLLLDPYAKALSGRTALERRPLSVIGSARRVRTCRSTAAIALPACPNASSSIRRFTWGDDRPPRTPWRDTIVYEAHVRGFSRCSIPASRRRCAARFSHSPRRPRSTYMRRLGITAIELLPVHAYRGRPNA